MTENKGAVLAREISELQRRNAYEEIISIIHRSAHETERHEAVSFFLHEADNAALRAGMPGLISEALFNAYLADPGSELLRDRLNAQLRRGNDYSMVARLLNERISNATGAEKASAKLEFGHFLQDVAGDYAEAARYFYESAVGNALESLIALQRLYRSDPSCAEAQRYCENLRKRMGVTEEAMAACQQQVNEAHLMERDIRAEILLDLAYFHLSLRGDTNRALDLIEPSLELSGKFRERAFAMLKSIGKAVPNQVQTLRRLRELLDANGSHTDAVSVAENELKILSADNERSKLLLYMAKSHGLFLNNELKAAQLLYMAFYVDPNYFIENLPYLSWPFELMTQSEPLRYSLFVILEDIGDKGQLFKYWDILVERGRGDVRDNALWGRARLEALYPASTESALSSYESCAMQMSDGNVHCLLSDLSDYVCESKVAKRLLSLCRRIATRSNRWESYFGILRQSFSERHFDNDEDKVAHLLDMALVAFDHLGDVRMAKAAGNAILQIYPDNGPAKDLLDRIRRSNENELSGNVVLKNISGVKILKQIVRIEQLTSGILRRGRGENISTLMELNTQVNALLSYSPDEEQLKRITSSFLTILNDASQYDADTVTRLALVLYRVSEYFNYFPDEIKDIISRLVDRYPKEIRLIQRTIPLCIKLNNWELTKHCLEIYRAATDNVLEKGRLGLQLAELYYDHLNEPEKSLEILTEIFWEGRLRQSVDELCVRMIAECRDNRNGPCKMSLWLRDRLESVDTEKGRNRLVDWLTIMTCSYECSVILDDLSVMVSEKFGDHPQLLLLLAQGYESAGNWEKAEKAYRRLDAGEDTVLRVSILTSLANIAYMSDKGEETSVAYLKQAFDEFSSEFVPNMGTDPEYVENTGYFKDGKLSRAQIDTVMTSAIVVALRRNRYREILKNLFQSRKRSSDYLKQANILKLLSEHFDQGEDAGYLNYWYALICEFYLSKSDEAMAIYKKISLDPLFRRVALEGMIRIVNDGTASLKLISLIESLLNLTFDETHRFECLLFYVSQLERFEGNKGKIFDKLVEAHRLKPANSALLERICELASEHNYLPQLIDVLRKDIELVDDNVLKCKFYLKIADISKNHLKDVTSTFYALRDAYSCDRSRVEILTQLDELAELCNFRKEAANFYRLWADESDEVDKKIFFLKKLVNLHIHVFDDFQHAYSTLIEIADLNKGDVFCIETTEFLASKFRRYDLLVEFFNHVDNSVFSAAQKLESLYRVSKLEESIKDGDISRAVEVLSLGIVVEPGNSASLNKLTEIIGDNTTLWRKCIEILLKYQDSTKNRVSILQTAATIYADRLSNPDRGLDLLIMILTLNHNNRSVFQQAVALSERTNRYDELHEMLDVTLESNDDPVFRRELLSQKLNLCELSGNEEMRFKCLQKIIEIDPENLVLINMLMKLNGEALPKDQKVALLLMQAKFSADSESWKEKMLLVTDHYEKYGMLDKAVSILKQMIMSLPDSLEIRRRLLALLLHEKKWDDAELSMKTIIGLSKDDNLLPGDYESLSNLIAIQKHEPERAMQLLCTLSAENKHYKHAFPTLKKLASELNKGEVLAEHFEFLLAEASSAEEKKIVTLLLCDVYLNLLDKPRKALPFLEELENITRFPDGELYNALKNVYERLEMWEDELRVLALMLPLVSTVQEKVAIFVNIQDIQANIFGDYEAAQQNILYAIALNSSDPKLWITRAKIFLKTDDRVSAIEALKSAADLQENGKEKAEILAFAASLYDYLGKYSMAAEFYKRALEAFPANVTIAEELKNYAIRQFDVNAYNDAVNIQLQNIVDPHEKHYLLIQKAVTLVEDFGDTENARFILNTLLDYLDELYTAHKIELAELCRLLDEKYAALEILRHIEEHDHVVSEDVEARIDALYQYFDSQASLISGSLDMDLSYIFDAEAAAAVSSYRQVVQDYQDAKWEGLFEKIDAVLSDCDAELSDEQKAELYFIAADLLLSANEFENADTYFRYASLLSPGNKKYVDAHLNLLIRSENWDLALPLFEQLYELSDDQEEKGAIRKRTAELCLYYLQDPVRAIEHYEKALLLGGDVDDVPAKLLELYISVEDWEKALFTALRLADDIKLTPFSRAEYYIIYAEILFGKKNEYRDALQAYVKALKIDPSHEGLIETLGTILSQVENETIVSDICESVVDIVAETNDNEGVDKVIRMILGFPERLRIVGIAALERIAKKTPGYVPLERALAELYAGTKNVEKERAHRVEMLKSSVLSWDDLLAFKNLFAERKMFKALTFVRELLHYFSPAEFDAPEPLSVHKFPDSLDSDIYKNFILHPDANTPLAAIFSILAKIPENPFRSPSPDELRLVGKQKLWSQSVAQLFNSPRIAASPTHNSSVLFCDTPTVLLPASMDNEREWLYCLTEACVLAEQRFIFVCSLSPVETVTILGTLPQLLGMPTAGVPSMIDASAAKKTQLLLTNPFSPLQDLRIATQRAQAANQGNLPPAASLIRGAQSTAARMGLLFSQSLSAALNVLLVRNHVPTRDFDAFRKRALKDAVLRDIVAFSLSKAFDDATHGLFSQTQTEVKPPSLPEIGYQDTDIIDITNLF